MVGGLKLFPTKILTLREDPLCLMFEETEIKVGRNNNGWIEYTYIVVGVVEDDEHECGKRLRRDQQDA